METLPEVEVFATQVEATHTMNEFESLKISNATYIYFTPYFTQEDIQVKCRHDWPL